MIGRGPNDTNTLQYSCASSKVFNSFHPNQLDFSPALKLVLYFQSSDKVYLVTTCRETARGVEEGPWTLSAILSAILEFMCDGDSWLIHGRAVGIQSTRRIALNTSHLWATVLGPDDADLAANSKLGKKARVTSHGP
ncbi:hypothetical protein AC1031_017588 [Aphanomyces cochlioides]|nr:hypothetical protein AC1031_017588 [Aphanomyces cochlioides]